jgi:hypothetical protein
MKAKASGSVPPEFGIGALTRFYPWRIATRGTAPESTVSCGDAPRGDPA